MKKVCLERRSGKDRRQQPRYYFGTQCGERRRALSSEKKTIWSDNAKDFWPQAV